MDINVNVEGLTLAFDTNGGSSSIRIPAALSQQGIRRVMRLQELAKSLDLDELVVVTWIYEPAPRHRSYELLAKMFGLG